MNLLRALAVLLLVLPIRASAAGATNPPGVRSGGTGDASNMSVAVPGQSVLRRLSDWWNDRANLVGYGADPTGALDSTSAIRSAVASGKPVSCVPGGYKVSGSLGTLAAGQAFTGDGVTSCRLLVTSAFASSGASSLIDTRDSSRLDGVGIVFDQSSTTSRATVTQYPWAVDIRNAPRVDLGRIRISGAWNGINGLGNPGGMNADLLEIGAYNKGVVLDGLLDFAHINTIHCWVFGATSSIIGDGSTTCLEVGKAEGLDIKSVTTYQQAVVINTNAGSGAAQRIGHVQLDGDNARLTQAGGTMMYGQVASTKSSAPTLSDVVVSGGTATVEQVRLWGTPGAAQLSVTGGYAVIGGGSLEQYNTAAPSASVSGGTLILSSALLKPGDLSATRTAPYVSQTGAGVLVATNNTAAPKGSSGSGTLVGIGQDNAGNHVAGNQFSGWGYALPAGAVATNGSYGPNRVAPFTWTPTFTFATPGDSAFSYTQQNGRYWYEENGIRVIGRITANVNAYTTASGNLSTSGFPATVPGGFVTPMTVGQISNFKLGTGYTGFAGVQASDGTFQLRQTGSGVGEVTLTTAQVPASTTGLDVSFTVFIPTIQ